MSIEKSVGQGREVRIFAPNGHMDAAKKRGSGEVRDVPAQFRTDTSTQYSLLSPSSRPWLESVVGITISDRAHGDQKTLTTKT